MRTVLITGCSSGYGREIAEHFHANGWNVIATMRNPRADLLQRSERMRVLPLDVTSPDSIAAAFALAGPIDVLVNNAGIGVVGAFEATPMSTTREIFETNTFGAMAMMQAVVPQFRQRGSGIIVNVTSSVCLASMPLAAVYTASKAAVDGLTGSVAFELASFGVRVKLVQPGYGPSTSFTTNGGARMQGLIPPAYQPFAAPIFAAFGKPAAISPRSATSRKPCGMRCMTAPTACTSRPAQTRLPSRPLIDGGPAIETFPRHFGAAATDLR